MHDTANSHGAAPGDESAETFAQSLIGKVDALGLLRLLRLLPSEAPARGSRIKGQGSEFSFTTGAYTYDHGAKLGLRQNCRLFPCVTRALCEYVSTRAPEARYTTLALFRDLRSKVHADLGNDPQQCNNIFRLSKFQDGGLWLECGDGDQTCPLPGEGHRKGRVVDFRQDRISFDAQVPHCVMPWHGGSRVVLVAFTVRNHDRITAQDVNDLHGLGFQLPARSGPTTSGGDCVRVGVSKQPPQSSGCLRPSLASPPVVLTPNAKVLSPLSSDPTAGPGSVPLGDTATSVRGPDDGTSGVMRTEAGLYKPSFFLNSSVDPPASRPKCDSWGFRFWGLIISRRLSRHVHQSSTWTCVTPNSRIDCGPRFVVHMSFGSRLHVERLRRLGAYLFTVVTRGLGRSGAGHTLMARFCRRHHRASNSTSGRGKVGKPDSRGSAAKDDRRPTSEQPADMRHHVGSLRRVERSPRGWLHPSQPTSSAGHGLEPSRAQDLCAASARWLNFQQPTLFRCEPQWLSNGPGIQRRPLQWQNETV